MARSICRCCASDCPDCGEEAQPAKSDARQIARIDRENAELLDCVTCPVSGLAVGDQPGPPILWFHDG